MTDEDKPLLRFTLSGQIHGGKNHIGITRTGRRYPKKLFVDWRTESMLQLQAQGLKSFGTLLNPVKLVCRYTRADDRRRDVPAILDALLHLMERCRIVEDDSLIVSLEWIDCPKDKEKPGIEVEVWAWSRR